MKKNFIKEFWDNQGNVHGDSHWASWGDKYMLELEIDLISGFMNDNNFVLDVGCANGYSTIQQIKRNPGIKIHGIDFSESMISAGNKKLLQLTNEEKSKIKFDVGDIRKINFPDDTFDKVYTTRVLINLPNWEEQKMGIKELLRVVKKGGQVILLEAFYEPLVLLNSLRSLKNLDPLEEHDFNRYLKIHKMDTLLKSEKLKFERIDFSSIYYLGSRFIRELVTDVNAFEGYSNPINELFFNIEKEYSGGGFGIQQAYVLNT